ncbi:MAG: hypothetical protein IKV38_03085 [Clostridia bacterium]|nr:hypothetical protein [Clostridia bacterium]
MKKIWLFVLVAVYCFGLAFFVPHKPTHYFKGDAEVFFNYPVNTHFDYIDLGFGRLVFCESKDVKNLPQDYFAISITIKQSEWQKAKERLFVTEIMQQTSQDFCTKLLFSKMVVGGVFVNGNKINMQVAYLDDFVKIGFPLIVGSF